MGRDFDVVVPCYGYGPYLRQCVKTVLEQRKVNVRVIIVDDASPDETPEVSRRLAEDDARVTYIRHQVNMGHIASYNEGLAMIGGDYVLLLSADDYLLPGALARAADIMEANPAVGLVFGRANALFDDGSTIAMCPLEHDRIMSGQEYIEMSGGVNPVPTPTAIVRSVIQREAGFYSSSLPHSGDMEMWLRIAARSSVAYLDVEQAVYRRHRSNMSSAYFKAMLPDIEQRLAAIEKFFAEHAYLVSQTPKVKTKALDRLARDAITNASMAFNEGNVELCDRLRAKALMLSEAAPRTRQWRNLEVKRCLGLRIWNTVSSWRKPRAAV